MKENTGKTRVISAFPGTGKSFYYNQYRYSSEKVVLDSDSSTFDKSDFPANYIRHIQNNIGVADVIFVSSHKVVRDALNEAGIIYSLVYPAIELKAEYLARYEERGNNQNFIDLVAANWETWHNEMISQPGCNMIELDTNEYIDDYL